MNEPMIFAAKWLLWLMVAGCGLVWLVVERRDGKLRLAAAAIIGLVLTVALMKLCGALYYDPRPFVVDPSITPLIPHKPDNGFPSHHACAAGLMAALILLRRRLIGVLFVIAAVIIAWARVAVHVHHVVDVVAGLVLGAVAAAIATYVVALWFKRHGDVIGSRLDD